MLSREQAAVIAREEAINRQIGFEVTRVVAPEEITYPTMLYNTSLDNCWIAYLKPLRGFFIESSMIVVIDQSTGNVRYAGSAHDEG